MVRRAPRTLDFSLPTRPQRSKRRVLLDLTRQRPRALATCARPARSATEQAKLRARRVLPALLVKLGRLVVLSAELVRRSLLALASARPVSQADSPTRRARASASLPTQGFSWRSRELSIRNSVLRAPTPRAPARWNALPARKGGTSLENRPRRATWRPAANTSPREERPSRPSVPQDDLAGRARLPASPANPGR